LPGRRRIHRISRLRRKVVACRRKGCEGMKSRQTLAALAVVLGILTRRYGSIVPAIACHATLIWSQVILWPAVVG